MKLPPNSNVERLLIKPESVRYGSATPVRGPRKGPLAGLIWVATSIFGRSAIERPLRVLNRPARLKSAQ